MKTIILSSDTIRLEVQIRNRIVIFMLGMVVSGLTALPIEWELRNLYHWLAQRDYDNAFTQWIELAYNGVRETNLTYPFMAYGTDWLAFAHVIIAIAFIGPLSDPVRNQWVIQFGIIACLAIFPFAFIAGYARGIPFFWRLIDCAFGILGGLLLLNCYAKIKLLEKSKHQDYEYNS